MIKTKSKKPIVVQANEAALLSSQPMRYVPFHHALLGGDLTSAVVYSQLEYLWRCKAEKISATPVQEVFVVLSYSQLIKYYFSWMTRRNLIRIIRELEQKGIVQIDRSKKKKNRYAIAGWSQECLDIMAQQIKYAPTAFILVFPQLANLTTDGVKLGLLRAILLQRIHYMSREPGLIVVSQANIRKCMYHCVSLKTIQRAIADLVSLGILVSDTDVDEAATIYAIDYDYLQSLFSIKSATEFVNEFDECETKLVYSSEY